MPTDIRAPLADASLVVAHDPGAKPGYAVFSRDRATRCWVLLACGAVFEHGAWKFDVVISEFPEHRVQGARVDVNAIIRLAWTGGGQAATIRAAHRFEVTPSRWKGAVPKRVHHGRIIARLSTFERPLLAVGACADCKRMAHGANHEPNCLDAVGLGLWYLGRWDDDGTR